MTHHQPPEFHLDPSAIVRSQAIGSDSYIAALALVDTGAVLHHNVQVQAQSYVGKAAQLGAHTVLQPRVVIGDHAQLSAHCVVGEGAIVAPGILVAPGVHIEPGSVVSRNVPAHAIVQGNPAIIIGYTRAHKDQKTPASPSLKIKSTPAASTTSEVGNVKGVRLHKLHEVQDLRGFLCAAELGQGTQSSVPFAPKRCFWVYSVPNAEIRGAHAHKQCAQFLVALAGSVRVTVDDGTNRQIITLNKPYHGLYLPPMVWGIQDQYTENAVLMVLASEHYDPLDYIRDYDEFVTKTRSA